MWLFHTKTGNRTPIRVNSYSHRFCGCLVGPFHKVSHSRSTHSNWMRPFDLQQRPWLDKAEWTVDRSYNKCTVVRVKSEMKMVLSSYTFYLQATRWMLLLQTLQQSIASGRRGKQLNFRTALQFPVYLRARSRNMKLVNGEQGIKYEWRNDSNRK